MTLRMRSIAWEPREEGCASAPTRAALSSSFNGIKRSDTYTSFFICIGLNR
jgi:hypothetical protein